MFMHKTTPKMVGNSSCPQFFFLKKWESFGEKNRIFFKKNWKIGKKKVVKKTQSSILAGKTTFFLAKTGRK